jgi:hypothetical protein
MEAVDEHVAHMMDLTPPPELIDPTSGAVPTGEVHGNDTSPMDTTPSQGMKLPPPIPQEAQMTELDASALMELEEDVAEAGGAVLGAIDIAMQSKPIQIDVITLRPPETIVPPTAPKHPDLDAVPTQIPHPATDAVRARIPTPRPAARKASAPAPLDLGDPALVADPVEAAVWSYLKAMGLAERLNQALDQLKKHDGMVLDIETGLAAVRSGAQSAIETVNLNASSADLLRIEHATLKERVLRGYEELGQFLRGDLKKTFMDALGEYGTNVAGEVNKALVTLLERSQHAFADLKERVRGYQEAMDKSRKFDREQVVALGVRFDGVERKVIAREEEIEGALVRTKALRDTLRTDIKSLRTKLEGLDAEVDGKVQRAVAAGLALNRSQIVAAMKLTPEEIVELERAFEEHYAGMLAAAIQQIETARDAASRAIQENREASAASLDAQREGAHGDLRDFREEMRKLKADIEHAHRRNTATVESERVESAKAVAKRRDEDIEATRDAVRKTVRTELAEAVKALEKRSQDLSRELKPTRPYPTTEPKGSGWKDFGVILAVIAAVAALLFL